MRTWRVAALAVVVLGCGSGGGTAGTPGARPAPRSDYSVIGPEELDAATEFSLFDFIRAHRSRWLSQARPTALRSEREAELVVYLDNVRLGGIETLRQVPPRSVTFVRFLSPAEAHAQFGPGHLNGAILVTSRP